MRRARERTQEAFRPGTQANLRSHVLLYVAFAQAFGFRDFPATCNGLLVFAEFMLDSVKAPKSVLNALASIKHYHLDHDFSVVAFDTRRLRLWRRALPHTVRHVPRQAPPINWALLCQLCQLSLQLGDGGVVFAALMAFLFASMARLSSLLPQSHLQFDTTRMPTFADVVEREGQWHLRIKWAKAHQDAEMGFWVPLLPRGGLPACPVARWEDLRRVRGRGAEGGPLFWVAGGSGMGREREQPLTMSVARGWLKILLTRLGRGNEGFSFHSFRRGACTSAFQGGASEGDLRALGGWHSEAVRCYLPVGESRRRAARALATPDFF